MTFIREAKEISKNPGSRIIWRPDGILNLKDPEYDLAEVTEVGMEAPLENHSPVRQDNTNA